jgi:hypothetical protein
MTTCSLLYFESVEKYFYLVSFLERVVCFSEFIWLFYCLFQGLGPSFLRAIADPETKKILVCGTGGGFGERAKYY